MEVLHVKSHPFLSKGERIKGCPPLFVRQTIICHSAEEAKAFLRVMAHKIVLRETRFVVTGFCLNRELIDGITGKVALVFGRDVLGKLWDIKIAGWLNRQEIALRFDEGVFLVSWREEIFRFAEGRLTLNAFERASGFRSGVRTYKPKGYATFLEQLNNS